ncbi:hypothetical protein ON010_g16586 [Phytophthora cinnamomi]|nr:hypothetical protein ON010_g16586 [Phytophthora cinnamomi]
MQFRAGALQPAAACHRHTEKRLISSRDAHSRARAPPSLPYKRQEGNGDLVRTPHSAAARAGLQRHRVPRGRRPGRPGAADAQGAAAAGQRHSRGGGRPGGPGGVRADPQGLRGGVRGQARGQEGLGQAGGHRRRPGEQVPPRPHRRPPQGRRPHGLRPRALGDPSAGARAVQVRGGAGHLVSAGGARHGQHPGDAQDAEHQLRGHLGPSAGGDGLRDAGEGGDHRAADGHADDRQYL